MNTILLLIFAYICGSIPTGYWVVKAKTGIDLRKVGSGSTGTTNVLRTAGKSAAAIVFFVDIFKGFLPVWVSIYALDHNMLPELQSNPTLANFAPWLVFIVTLVTMIGHSKSIFLNFAGGKSAATGLGTILAMSAPAGLSTFAIFVTVVYLSRFVSLGSIAAGISCAIMMYIFAPEHIPYIAVCAAAGFYVVLRHKANIKRLIDGTEPRIGEKAKLPEQAPEDSTVKQAQP